MYMRVSPDKWTRWDIYGKGDVSSDKTGLPSVVVSLRVYMWQVRLLWARLVTATMLGTDAHERLKRGSGVDGHG